MSKKHASFKRRGVRTKVGPICGLIALAVIPAAVIPAAAQQSSDDFRYMTVLQRPREDYDPKGIPVGAGFRFLPSLEVAESYTDNLYATETDKVSDYQTSISPKLELKSNWSRHSLSVSGYADIHRYLDRTTEDHDNYGGEGSLGLELGGGGSFGLTGGYDHTTVPRGDPEERSRLASGLVIAPEVVDVTHARAEWGQQFSFLLLGARAELLQFAEEASSDRDKDRSEYTAAFRVGYVFSPALNAFVEPTYTRRDFDLAVDFGGINRDSEVMGINAGVAYDITGLLYGETKVGWYRAGFADPRIKTSSGVSIESKTTWNVTARDTFIFQVSRKNIVTNDPGSSSRVQTGGEVEYQHELLRNVILQAKASYYNDDFLNDGAFATAGAPRREEDTISGTLRGDYYFNRYLSFYLSYAYTKLDSTIAGDSYKENLVMIGIHTHI